MEVALRISLGKIFSQAAFAKNPGVEFPSVLNCASLRHLILPE
jgi:hypothetical protein